MGILMLVWWWGGYVKIDVLCTRELDWQGSGGSENRLNSGRFLEGAKSAPLGDTFGDLCDFGRSMWSQRGSMLATKVILFEV